MNMASVMVGLQQLPLQLLEAQHVLVGGNKVG